MPKPKKIILAIIDLMKSLFFLSHLNQNELQGLISPLSKLRFMPYSRVRVPYYLGRTVRGVSFDNNLMNNLGYSLINKINDYYFSNYIKY